MHPNVSLFRRCVADRDESSWEDFVGRFGRYLRRRLKRALRQRGRLPDRELLDDLGQELYCRLLSPGARAFRGESEGELVNYLGRIADRLVLDRIRAASTRKRGGGRATVATDLESLVVELCDSSPSPEQRVLARERRRLFAVRCRRVLRGSRAQLDLQILRLWVLEGLTSREIADALGGDLAPAGVESRLHRLRRRLAAAGVKVPRRLAG